MYVARARPCTQSVHGRVHGHIHGTYTAMHTGRKHGRLIARVHGCVCTMYTAVHGPSMTRTRPCTRSCTCTRPSTARVRGRVPCTCTCLRPVYTAVYRLRTGHVHGRSRRVRTVYTTTRCIPGIAKVYIRNLLDGYYANPIIRSLENDLFTFSAAVTF